MGVTVSQQMRPNRADAVALTQPGRLASGITHNAALDAVRYVCEPWHTGGAITQLSYIFLFA